MGKKDLNESSSYIHHVNYMYQCAHFALSKGHTAVSNYYLDLTSAIARKSLLKMEPNVKRNICKGCSGLLIPGLTANVHIVKKPPGFIHWKCTLCHTLKRFRAERNYKPQFELLQMKDRDSNVKKRDIESVSNEVNVYEKLSKNCNK